MRVYYKKQCGISDLSEHMEITAAAASQTVDKLVQLGLLDRAEDPNDRRAKQLTLSASGRELIEKSVAERFRWLDALENSLSAEQKTKIRESLTILMAAADEIDE